MKILCPTDFSPQATNAIEYAAKLAQKTGATLTLLNVQRIFVSDGISLFAGGEFESVKEARVAAKSMDEVCLDINKIFNVSCNYEVIPQLTSLEKTIAREAGDFNLTVIGTNGADDLYELAFGSHSFNVSKRARNAVLVVPELCAYKDMQTVVYACDYNKSDNLLLKQLKEFLDAFNSKLIVTHVSRKSSPVGNEIYHTFTNLIEEAFDYNRQIEFKRIIAQDPELALEEYLNETNADLLAVSLQPHGWFYRFFHENLIQLITSRANHPVLILHE